MIFHTFAELSFLLGNFSCHVWNNAGDSKYIYELIVYKSPIIENFTQNQTFINVIESKNISIECLANGVPTPKVLFFLNLLLYIFIDIYLPFTRIS